MSLVAPREGEGRRTEWRSGAKRELHGGRDRMMQRVEAENYSQFATRFADAGPKTGSNEIVRIAPISAAVWDTRGLTRAQG